MEEIKLGVMEARFADIIWEHAPISTGELVKICPQQFGWTRTTTYTMLKRLCERGIFQNNGSVVSAVLSKEDFAALQSESFVEETFSGSLPRFLAAFTRRKKLSAAEVEEIQKLIDQYQEG